MSYLLDQRKRFLAHVITLPRKRLKVERLPACLIFGPFGTTEAFNISCSSELMFFSAIFLNLLITLMTWSIVTIGSFGGVLSTGVSGFAPGGFHLGLLRGTGNAGWHAPAHVPYKNLY